MGIFNKKKKVKKKKGLVREWVDALVFAVIAATLIRWVAVEAYKIPTGSMESTLLAGDFLFVSKLHYGPRTPKTPLQVPLTHQTIWGTQIPSYSDAIQLPQFRLWYLPIERGDVVVFNYPYEDNHPSDLKTNYIKRCVALPGDELKIEGAQVHINGKASENPVDMQYYFWLVSNETDISSRVFDRYGVAAHTFASIQNSPSLAQKYEGKKVNMYRVLASHAKVKKMVEELDFVYDFAPAFAYDKGVKAQTPLFPFDDKFKWNIDYYGSLKIPAEGVTVKLTADNIAIYERIISVYENEGKDVVIDGAKVTINGDVITEYTFQQDYYFMMGDNRHNSADSRLWGLVPYDHIVGKGWLVWFSMDLDPAKGNLLERIRWNRILSIID
jgi:signal peptidase I